GGRRSPARGGRRGRRAGGAARAVRASGVPRRGGHAARREPLRGARAGPYVIALADIAPPSTPRGALHASAAHPRPPFRPRATPATRPRALRPRSGAFDT